MNKSMNEEDDISLCYKDSIARCCQPEENKTFELPQKTLFKDVSFDNIDLTAEKHEHSQHIEPSLSQSEVPHTSSTDSEAMSIGNDHPSTINNQTAPRRHRSLEQEFNQNTLQYLVHNLENLREVLQSVVTNAELAQNLSVDIRGRNSFNLSVAQAFNSAQLSILNSQNQIYDQLNDIRRIVSANDNNEQENSLLDFINMENARLARQNRLQNLETNFILRTYNSLRSGVARSSNLIFWFGLVIAVLSIFIEISSTPNTQNESYAVLIETIAFKNQSKLVLLVSKNTYSESKFFRDLSPFSHCSF